ncbi:MAG: hypothetical protein IIA72_24045 [Proteobacteria bacterium]|nr:hypothetical protein [Pseudomonadota bacterium]
MQTPSCSPYLLRRLRSLREVCRAIHPGGLSPCTPCAYREICRAMEAKRQADPWPPSIQNLATYRKDKLHETTPPPEIGEAAAAGGARPRPSPSERAG